MDFPLRNSYGRREFLRKAKGRAISRQEVGQAIVEAILKTAKDNKWPEDDTAYMLREFDRDLTAVYGPKESQ